VNNIPACPRAAGQAGVTAARSNPGRRTAEGGCPYMGLVAGRGRAPDRSTIIYPRTEKSALLETSATKAKRPEASGPPHSESNCLRQTEDFVSVPLPSSSREPSCRIPAARHRSSPPPGKSTGRTRGSYRFTPESPNRTFVHGCRPQYFTSIQPEQCEHLCTCDRRPARSGGYPCPPRSAINFIAGWLIHV